MDKKFTRTLATVAIILVFSILASAVCLANPFKEKGKKSTRQFKLPPGVYLFQVEHKGFSNFTINFKQADGSLTKTLAKGVGPYQGVTVVGIPPVKEEAKAPKFFITGDTDGIWIITVKSTVKADDKRKFEGDTKTREATGLFKLKAGTYDFKVKHKGGRQFSALLLNGHGRKVVELAKGIGSVNEKKRVVLTKDGSYIIDVTASGKWTIDIEEVIK